MKRSLACLLLTSAFASSASATPVVEILFDDGTSQLSVAPGDPVVARIVIRAGAEGISSYAVSLRFDDELDLTGAAEGLPTGFDLNLSAGFELLAESTGAALGQVSSCEAAALGAGAGAGSFIACEFSFVATDALAADGADLFVGLFAPGVDGIFSGAGDDLAAAAAFATASLVPIPEPSATLLVGAGLLGLARFGRRRGGAGRSPGYRLP